jgi:hypothetical protein
MNAFAWGMRDVCEGPALQGTKRVTENRAKSMLRTLKRTLKLEKGNESGEATEYFLRGKVRIWMWIPKHE